MPFPLVTVFMWNNKIWLLLTSSSPLSDSYTLDKGFSIKFTRTEEYGLHITITKLWQMISATDFNLGMIELLTFHNFCGSVFQL